MRPRGHRIAAAALIAVGACAGAAGAQTPATGVTVYSSLPLEGATRQQAQAIVAGARLALADAGGAVAGHPVRYVSLDDGTPRAGAWTPERTAANARRAISDPSVAGYIGEFNSAASAVSLPILNEAGVPEISPGNTAIGLTRGGPGALAGEPARYYPTGRRTYFRLTPNDRIQAGALAAAMRARGCRRAAILTDGEVYGTGIASWTRRFARRVAVRVVLRRTIAPRLRSYARLARRVRHARAGCVVYAGLVAHGAAAVFESLRRVRLFGPEALAEPSFTRHLPARAARRVLVTSHVLAPSAYPPAGQAILSRYPDPYALYGYDAMRLILDAVAAAGTSHAAVVGYLHTAPSRPRALGTYRFDRFGDTTRRTFGTYRIRGGALVYAGSVEAP